MLFMTSLEPREKQKFKRNLKRDQAQIGGLLSDYESDFEAHDSERGLLFFVAVAKPDANGQLD